MQLDQAAQADPGLPGQRRTGGEAEVGRLLEDLLERDGELNAGLSEPLRPVTVVRPGPGRILRCASGPIPRNPRTDMVPRNAPASLTLTGPACVDSGHGHVGRRRSTQRGVRCHPPVDTTWIECAFRRSGPEPRPLILPMPIRRVRPRRSYRCSSIVTQCVKGKRRPWRKWTLLVAKAGGAVTLASPAAMSIRIDQSAVIKSMGSGGSWQKCCSPSSSWHCWCGQFGRWYGKCGRASDLCLLRLPCPRNR